MENPKLALIPSGYKSGKVYSILPTDGVGDFDFSRGSTSTRVDRDGLIETVTNNVPRLDWLNSDCPSLLLEPQRTNKILQSENWGTSWSFFNGASVSVNQIISPDGTMTADKIISNGSNFSFTKPSSNPVISTGNTTFSLFVKADNRATGWLRLDYGTTIYNRKFDLTTQTFSSGFDNTGNIPNSEQIIDYGNGWYRLIITDSADTTSFEPRIYVTGNTGSSANDSLFIWGAQVEQGSYPTSYIKTTGIEETRLKDFIDGAGSSSLFNSLESTFFVEMASFLNAQTNSNGIELAGIGSQNRITLQYDTTNNQIRCDVRVLNSAQAIITTSSFDITNFNKMAITYKLNEVKFYVNGQLISTDTSVNTFAPNTLTEVRSTIADISGGAFNLQAKIKDLRVYNRVLTEAESIELTTI